MRVIRIQSSVAYQCLAQDVRLHLTLQTDIGMLEVASTAPEGQERRAPRSNSMRVGDHDFDRLRPGESTPNIRHFCDNALARKGVANEDDEAIVAGNHVPTVGHIADVDSDSIPD